MAPEKLGDFLQQQCKERGLSLRGLSMNAGLSPGTAHNYITRKYQPTLSPLNRLADYLGVKRQYLWQLAGLLDDMEYSDNTTWSDPRLRFYFAQADKLPEAERTVVVDTLKTIVGYFQARDQREGTNPFTSPATGLEIDSRAYHSLPSSLLLVRKIPQEAEFFICLFSLLTPSSQKLCFPILVAADLSVRLVGHTYLCTHHILRLSQSALLF